MKRLLLDAILYITATTGLYSQNKFFLEVNLIGRNSEQYNYLEYTPYSPKISEVEDIPLFSSDLGGNPNYAIYLKYKQSKYITWSIGYETFLIKEKLAINSHLFCNNCINTFEFNFGEYSHNLPIHLELHLPICKSLKKIKLTPLIGANIIYNEPQKQNNSSASFSDYYTHLGKNYALNSIDAKFETLRHWNLGLRYGGGLEVNLFKDIRLNLTFLAQHGLFEVQKTSFTIKHLDLLFNNNAIEEGLWVNKQSLFSKRLGIIVPMDWVYDVVKTKPLKKIFTK